MSLGTVPSVILVALIFFLVGGLAIQGPLETAIASTSGLERVILLPLEAWAALAQLAADALT